jgi:hypothetical protein
LGDLQGFEHATIGMLESIAAPFSLFGVVYQRSDNPGRRAGFPDGGGRLEVNGARDWHSGGGGVFVGRVVEGEDLEDVGAGGPCRSAGRGWDRWPVCEEVVEVGDVGRLGLIEAEQGAAGVRLALRRLPPSRP